MHTMMYLKSRNYVYGDKAEGYMLMDMAVIAMKELRKDGKLEDLDVIRRNKCLSV